MARKRERTGSSQVTKRKRIEVKSEEPSYVSLRSRKNTRYIIYGRYTGDKYIFETAGSIVSIDSRDAEELLKKKTPRSCCGSLRQGYVFEIVEKEG